MSSARVVALGEILAEFVAEEPSGAPGGGHARTGRYLGPFPSGAPAIFVEQAARCGARAAMVGGVGADGFGRLALERLRAAGVDLGGVRVDPARPTGVAFVAYDASGAREFVFLIEGSAATEMGAPGAEWLGAGAVLHLSGSSLGIPAIRARAMATLRAHRAAGGEVSFDPNVRPELMREPAARAALREAVAAAGILLPSLEDLEGLHPGLAPEAAVARMLEGGARVVALKRGAAGALVASRDEWVDLPGHAVEAADPTGAGDGFGGTLVALLAQGAPLASAARRANAAGALSVRRVGPMEGNSDLARIDAFLKGSGARSGAALGD